MPRSPPSLAPRAGDGAAAVQCQEDTYADEPRLLTSDDAGSCTPCAEGTSTNSTGGATACLYVKPGYYAADISGDAFTATECDADKARAGVAYFEDALSCEDW